MDATASPACCHPHRAAGAFRSSPRAGGLHELAERLDAAAVVVGSSHRGAVGRLFIGDVGAGLMHGSACPVVIAPRDYAASAGVLQRIGVAFDGTPESRVALVAGIGLARRAGGTVHAFTVLQPVEWTPSYAWPGPYPSQELEEARERWAQSTAAEALEAIPDGTLGASEVIRGPVRQSLAGVTAQLDVLACGSRGYGAVRQVAAGSVARTLAHEAACPPARGAARAVARGLGAVAADERDAGDLSPGRYVNFRAESVQTPDEGGLRGCVNGSMSSPIRREADLARLAARERRLRLVMQILSGREAELRRSRQPTPPGLRQSIADFGVQLGDVHRRQAELAAERGQAAVTSPGSAPARTSTYRQAG